MGTKTQSKKCLCKNQIVITPAAELFMEFKISTTKQGKEYVYLEDNPTTKHILLRKINTERKYAFKRKRHRENNPYIDVNLKDNLTKLHFDIKDDIGEINTKSSRDNVIGTTLVNFFNKLDGIIPILNKYIRDFKNSYIQKLKQNKQQDIQMQYLNDIEKLEDDIKLELNQPLKVLISRIFKIFYMDYKYLMNNPDELYEFKNKAGDNLKRKPYNTYYKLVYKYMTDIENVSASDISKRFEQFNIKDIIEKFLQSIQEDICYMLNNYNNLELNLDYMSVYTMNQCNKIEISSLRELFCYSKYYIAKDGRALQYCKLCGRFFITDFRNTETHCKRIYDKTEQRNCCDESNFNSSKGYGLKMQIDKELSDIYLKLLIKDCKNNTFEIECFEKQLYDNAKYRLNDELNKKNKLKYDKELLNWLKSKKEQIINN